MDKFELIKEAYGDLEKEALSMGWLGKILGMGGKGTRAAETAAETLTTGAKGVETATQATKPGLFKNVVSLTGLGDPAKGTWGHMLSAPLRPFLGEQGAATATGFGMMSGILGGAMADPGERMSGFAKGFGSGLLGGVGWTHGEKLMGGAMKRLAKPGTGFRGAVHTVTNPEGKLNTFGNIWNYGAPKDLPKLLGAKALTSGAGLAAAFGGNMLYEGLGSKYIPGLSETPKAQLTQQAGQSLGMGYMPNSLSPPQMGGPYGAY